MKRLVHWVLLTVLTAWASPLWAVSPCIDVVDRQGRKLANVGVTLGSLTRYTDQAGHVCFPDVPSGRYQITLRSGDVRAICNIATDRPNVQCLMPTP
jgi:hypothetical protein